jgi:hypothetical protein
MRGEWSPAKLCMLTSVLVSGLLLVAPTPVLAYVTFADDFNDNSLDLAKWLPTSGIGITIAEAGGMLSLSSEGGAFATVTTQHAFVGDFDVRVDFSLIQFPEVTSCHTTLQVSPIGSGATIVVKRYQQSGVTSNRHRYEFFRWQDGQSYDWASVVTTDTAGKFRILRVGTVFTGHYWSGSTWNAIGSTTSSNSPTTALLAVYGADLNPAVQVSFDNFQATGAEITGNLTGTVRDGDTGCPISGAQVRLQGQPLVTTDSAGTYWIAHVLPGPDLLAVSQSGYEPVSELPVTIEHGVNAVVDVDLWGLTARRPGDMNCDGVVTFADIDLFVEALAGESSWAHSPCPWLNADCNGDCAVNFADIDVFVALLSGDQ